MSKMSELATVKEELLRCSQMLTDLSGTLRDLAHTWDEESLPQPEATKPDAEPQMTLADIRGCLAQKSMEGHTEKVLALIRKYGAAKLSQVDPTHYPAMMAEAEGW